jgi:hypothetical protein
MNAVVETLPVATETPQQIVAANPLDISPEAFRGALARRGQNRKALMEWVRSSLVEGIDYGKIHVVGWKKCQLGNDCKNPAHYSKDCLFKPGSEKIAGMLGVTPTFPTLAKYEEAALAGIELKQIILRCHMLDGANRIVADGIGARSLAQDYDDLNKALKMCAKSAMIDATLRMAGLSEVFTQEYEEDEQPPGNTGNAPPPEQPKAPEGYERWKTDMNAKVSDGYDAFKSSWQAANKTFRQYANTRDKAWRLSLPEKAQAADAARAK